MKSGFWKWWRGKNNVAKKEVNSISEKSHKVSFAAPQEWKFSSVQAGDFFQKNPVVFRCMNLIMRSIASVEMKIYENNMHVSHHPLAKLMHTPNPFQGYNAFMEHVVGQMLIDGHVFLQYVKNVAGMPEEVYVLPASTVKIETNDKGHPVAYQHNGKKFSIGEHIWDSPILHINFFHPRGMFQGLSPLQPVLQSMHLHNMIVEHNVALLHNAGCPSGALIIRNDCLTPDETAQLKEQLSSMQGAGRGQKLLLQGDFEWKSIGFSPKDMDFSAVKNLAARDIAQAFGVPPLCIGITGDATFSNYQEARLHLWEDTLLPLLEWLLRDFNRWLAPHFGQNVYMGYSKDSISALTPRREALWDKMHSISVLTTNEKRKILGYPPLEEAEHCIL